MYVKPKKLLGVIDLILLFSVSNSNNRNYPNSKPPFLL